ncbi:MAG: rhomboid family intramembrane serine protease [Deltaproteobacteria bacterium]|nr:rhomboid family intramembrane serine protease [Deltaproteobacteria bacterium]
MKRRGAEQLRIFHAVVSAALCGAALVGFLVASLLGSQLVSERDSAQAQATSYYATHPYLEAPFEIMLGVEEGEGSEIDFEALASADTTAEQAELDALIAAWRAAEAETPAHRFGIAAGRTSVLGALLHALVHAGWLHLLWNIGLLVSAGARLELRLGRAHYGAVLGGSAVAGALAHLALAGGESAPFVGLSAATAGIVGAFAMRPGDTSRDPLEFAAGKKQRSPIRMAAAFGVIALGVCTLTGFSASSFSPLAQLGGLGAGAVAMLGFARLGWLRDEAAAPAPEVAQAIAQLKSGAAPAALQLLRARLAAQADDALAARAFGVALRGREDAREEIERAWTAAVDAKQPAVAAALWREAGMRGELPRAASERLQAFAKWRRADGAVGEARVALVAALAEADAATAGRIAREARRSDPVLTLRAAERALSLDSLSAADRGVMSDFAEQARKEAANNGVVVLDDAREAQRASSATKPTRPPQRPAPIELTRDDAAAESAAPPLDGLFSDADALIDSSAEPEVAAENTQPEYDANAAFFERGAIDLAPELPPAEMPEPAGEGDAALIDALHAALSDDADLSAAPGALDADVREPSASGAPLELGEAGNDLAAAESRAEMLDVQPPRLSFAPQRSAFEASGPVPIVALSVEPQPASVPPPSADELALSDALDDLFEDEKPEPTAPKLRPLRITTAKPLRLDADAIALDIEGRGRGKLAFAKIDAVSAAGVKGLTQSGKAVLFIDLALGFASGGEGELRVVRLRADAFDPRTLVPDEKSPLAALRKLIAELRARTRAIPLPRDAEPSAPFRIYADLASYEREVLGAQRPS